MIDNDPTIVEMHKCDCLDEPWLVGARKEFLFFFHLFLGGKSVLSTFFLLFSVVVHDVEIRAPKNNSRPNTLSH